MKSNVRRRKAAEFRVGVLSRQLSNREREVTALRQKLAFYIKQHEFFSALLESLIEEQCGGGCAFFISRIEERMKHPAVLMVKVEEENDALYLRVAKEDERVDALPFLWE